MRDLPRRGRFRHLVLDDRRRDDARGEDRREGRAVVVRPLLELGAVRGEREQMIELHLSDDIAWSVAGLAQVEQLFEADEPTGRIRPAARRPAGVELAGLVE